LCQADQIAIAIKRYKVVHTGANTQSGAVRKDLFRVEYQGSLYENVAILPINDAEYVIIANMIKDINLFFNIFILYIIFI
tara:strand:- start:198 stop:437 length:240 start_codon:yes stop_codon:yes gene_type:complete